MMGFGEFLMTALTAVTAAGSFVFALVMLLKDIWFGAAAQTPAHDVHKAVKTA
ncbi:MAG: hypothetical protein RRY12_13250 [Cloacibacillus sp.]